MLIAEAVILASADPQCSPADRAVLDTIATWLDNRTVIPFTGRTYRSRADIDDLITGRHLTLDRLAQQMAKRYPKPIVFGSVARLEDLQYLPEGAIR